MKLINISIRVQLSFPNLMIGYNTYRWRNMTILYNAMVELSLILFSVRIEVGKSGIMGFQKVYLTPTIVLERTPKITIDTVNNVVTMHNEMDGN